MSNYTITTNFGAKDSLPSTDAGKVIKGSEFTTEFTNIQTAVATKADTAGDTFTGVVNFSADVAVNTNTLFVDVSEAKVGIGTTSPANTLTVGNLTASANDQDATVGIKCNANHRGIILQENSGAEQWEIGVGAAGALKFYDSSSATPAVTFADETGNVGIGTASPATKLHISGDGDTNSKITVERTGATTGTNILGYDYIGTFANSELRLFTNSTEKMRIDSSGNVGIGTLNPSTTLDVNSGSIDKVASFESTDATAYISIKDGNTTTADAHGYGANGNTLSLYSNGVRAIDVNASGNVGIGTLSPDVKLDVTEAYDTVANILSNGSYAAKFSSSGSGDTGRTQGILLSGQDGNSRGVALLAEAQSTNNAHDFVIATSGVSATPTERMRIDASGNLLVGTTSATAMGTTNTGVVLRDNDSSYFARNSNGTIIAFFSGLGGAGSVSLTGNTANYNTTSDERLKENITDSADAGSKIDGIQIRQFDWIADGLHQDYGVIAQELATVAPEAVHQPEDSEEMMGVDYSKLVPMLIKEVQSLRSRVAELENV